MCEPVTLAASTAATAKLAISAASAAASIGSAVISANQQNKAAAQNQRSALDAYVLKTAAQNSRIRQEGIAASQKKEDARLKTLRSQGTATAAAAAGGVQGKSVGMLLDDYSRSESIFRDRTEQQLSADTKAIRFDMEGFRAEADNRIKSSPSAGVGALFGTAIQAGAGLFDAYQDYSETINGED